MVEAKLILESLTKNNQKNAASMLRERVLACEAADMLMTKDIRNMKLPAVQKLLEVTKDYFEWFPPTLKIKLAHFQVISGVFDAMKGSLESKEPGTVHQMQHNALKAYGESLTLTPCEASATPDGYDAFQPTFNAVFHHLIHAAYVQMTELKIIDAGSVAADDFDLDFKAAKVDGPEVEGLWQSTLSLPRPVVRAARAMN